MVKIRVYNVEHGDCISISDIYNKNNDNIVVVRDFGSKNGSVNRIISNIINHACKHSSCYLKHEAILTHPHKDHSSGFKIMHDNQMYNFFDKAYIPWLDFSKDDCKHSKMLKVGLYFIYYNDKSLLYKVKDWIKMAPMMYDLSKELHGIGTHYKFSWSVDSKVLWPPFPVDDKDAVALDELIDEFERIKGDNDNNVVRVYESMRNMLARITSGERHEINRESNTLSIINQQLNSLSQNENEVHFSTSILQNKPLYTNMIDDHSIVFSISNANNDSALFLSDLNEKPMGYMVDKFLKINHFKLLKSAHHGTRLSNNLQQRVTAEIIVHSCGIGQSNLKFLHPGYIQICNNQTIYCTSWNSNSPHWTKTQVVPYDVQGTMLFNL